MICNYNLAIWGKSKQVYHGALVSYFQGVDSHYVGWPNLNSDMR